MLATQNSVTSLPSFGEQGNDHGFVFKRVVARSISRKRKATDTPSVPNDSTANSTTNNDKQTTTQNILDNPTTSTTKAGPGKPTADNSPASNSSQNNNTGDDGYISSPEVARRSKTRVLSENDGPMILGNNACENKITKNLVFRTPLKSKKSNVATTLLNKNKSSVIKEMHVPLAKVQATPLIKATKRKGTPMASRASKNGRQSVLPGHPLGKNKRQPSVAGSKRRRSTFGIRGKRASSIGSGFSVHPHESVSMSDFYRHISPELPEPVRLRQLLTWCSRRLDLHTLIPGKPVHPIAQSVIDDMQRSLESGKVYLSWYRRTIDHDVIKSNQPQKQQAHPLNVKNTEKRAHLLKHIAELKQEYAKWKALLSKAGNDHVRSIDTLPNEVKKTNLNIALPDDYKIPLSAELRNKCLESVDFDTKSALEKATQIQKSGDEVCAELVKDTEVWIDTIGYQVHKDIQEQKKSLLLVKQVSRELSTAYERRSLKAATSMQTRSDVIKSDAHDLLRAFATAKSKPISKTFP
ncbi:hypothetical protein H4219_001475 [Mycoemilia scoparia]|uniref:Uncharacterized protein n=1 Tax=Mycoemilia scoparia TaxID=417184 RepID=A0A9W8A4R3_9FUNG|nr:hypothetical protein H4219_001475 [Mycoemilia scoparia]